MVATLSGPDSPLLSSPNTTTTTPSSMNALTHHADLVQDSPKFEDASSSFEKNHAVTCLADQHCRSSSTAIVNEGGGALSQGDQGSNPLNDLLQSDDKYDSRLTTSTTTATTNQPYSYSRELVLQLYTPNYEFPSKFEHHYAITVKEALTPVAFLDPNETISIERSHHGHLIRHSYRPTRGGRGRVLVSSGRGAINPNIPPTSTYHHTPGISNQSITSAHHNPNYRPSSTSPDLTTSNPSGTHASYGGAPTATANHAQRSTSSFCSKSNDERIRSRYSTNSWLLGDGDNQLVGSLNELADKVQQKQSNASPIHSSSTSALNHVDSSLPHYQPLHPNQTLPETPPYSIPSTAHPQPKLDHLTSDLSSTNPNANFVEFFGTTIDEIHGQKAHLQSQSKSLENNSFSPIGLDEPKSLRPHKDPIMPILMQDHATTSIAPSQPVSTIPVTPNTANLNYYRPGSRTFRNSFPNTNKSTTDHEYHVGYPQNHHYSNQPYHTVTNMGPGNHNFNQFDLPPLQYHLPLAQDPSAKPPPITHPDDWKLPSLDNDTWFYLDTKTSLQGPWSSIKMNEWLPYFDFNLPVSKSKCGPWLAVGQLFLDLQQNPFTGMAIDTFFEQAPESQLKTSLGIGLEKVRKMQQTHHHSTMTTGEGLSQHSSNQQSQSPQGSNMTPIQQSPAPRCNTPTTTLSNVPNRPLVHHSSPLTYTPIKISNDPNTGMVSCPQQPTRLVSQMGESLKVDDLFRSSVPQQPIESNSTTNILPPSSAHPPLWTSGPRVLSAGDPTTSNPTAAAESNLYYLYQQQQQVYASQMEQLQHLQMRLQCQQTLPPTNTMSATPLSNPSTIIQSAHPPSTPSDIKTAENGMPLFMEVNQMEAAKMTPNLPCNPMVDMTSPYLLSPAFKYPVNPSSTNFASSHPEQPSTGIQIQKSTESLNIQPISILASNTNDRLQQTLDVLNVQVNSTTSTAIHDKKYDCLSKYNQHSDDGECDLLMSLMTPPTPISEETQNLSDLLLDTASNRVNKMASLHQDKPTVESSSGTIPSQNAVSKSNATTSISSTTLPTTFSSLANPSSNRSSMAQPLKTSIVTSKPVVTTLPPPKPLSLYEIQQEELKRKQVEEEQEEWKRKQAERMIQQQQRHQQLKSSVLLTTSTSSPSGKNVKSTSAWNLPLGSTTTTTQPCGKISSNGHKDAAGVQPSSKPKSLREIQEEEMQESMQLRKQMTTNVQKSVPVIRPSFTGWGSNSSSSWNTVSSNGPFRQIGRVTSKVQPDPNPASSGLKNNNPTTAGHSAASTTLLAESNDFPSLSSSTTTDSKQSGTNKKQVVSNANSARNVVAAQLKSGSSAPQKGSIPTNIDHANTSSTATSKHVVRSNQMNTTVMENSQSIPSTNANSFWDY